MGIFNKDKKKKNKKKFKETGFGKFAHKVASKVPELAGDVLEIVTSPNPVGAGIDILKEKIQKKIGEDPSKDPMLRNLIDEMEINRREWVTEMYNIEVEDRKSARNMYQQKSSMADRVSASIIRYNLPVIASLLLIEIGCIFYLKEHPEILALISAAVGGVVQALISERLTVIQFFFGSSMGSKMKQEHIEGGKDE